MASSFLSQQEIENLLQRLNPDEVKAAVAQQAPQKTGELHSEPAQQLEQVEQVEFPELERTDEEEKYREVGYFQSVPVSLVLELGSATLTVGEILALQKNSVVRLDKLAGESAALCVNGRPLASGEVVVINDNFGFRVSELGAGAGRGSASERD